MRVVIMCAPLYGQRSPRRSVRMNGLLPYGRGCCRYRGVHRGTTASSTTCRWPSLSSCIVPDCVRRTAEARADRGVPSRGVVCSSCFATRPLRICARRRRSLCFFLRRLLPVFCVRRKRVSFSCSRLVILRRRACVARPVTDGTSSGLPATKLQPRGAGTRTQS